MKLKALLFAAAFAFSTTATSAFAAVPTVYPVELQQEGLTWTGEYGASHTAGDFTDIFTFTPSAISGLTDASIFTIAYSPQFGITFSSAYLNGQALEIVSGTIFPGSYVSVGGLTPTDLSGPLTLTVNGTSAYNASYVGTINVLTAVPEPGTYGMMLGGLGLLGFMARRRRQAK